VTDRNCIIIFLTIYDFALQKLDVYPNNSVLNSDEYKQLKNTQPTLLQTVVRPLAVVIAGSSTVLKPVSIGACLRLVASLS